MRSVRRGFIALTSAVIISAVLLCMAAAGSLRGWYARSNVLDTEFKLRSEALAQACADQALLLFAKDPLFGGNATTTVGDSVCHIGLVTSAATQKKFTVQAQYRAAYTNLHIVASADTLEVISWAEVPSY